jgi:tetratricopeptide (TPR) repeat protein
MKPLIFILLFIANINLYAQTTIKKVRFSTFPIPVTYIQYPSKSISSDYKTYNVAVNIQASEIIENNNKKPLELQSLIDPFIHENVRLLGFNETEETGDLTVNFTIEFFFSAHTVTENHAYDRNGNISSKSYVLKIPYAYKMSYKLIDNHDKKTLYDVPVKKGEISSIKEGRNYFEYKIESFSNENALASAISSIEKTKIQIFKDVLKGMCSSLNNSFKWDYGTQILRQVSAPFIRLDEDDFYEHYFYLKYMNDIKVILAKMTEKQGIEQFIPDLEPIIDYLESLISKYENTLINKTMAAASYYNIGLIYYYLDNPEQTLLYAQKVLDNDNKDNGTYLKNQALSLQHIFKLNNKISRHQEN